MRLSSLKRNSSLNNNPTPIPSSYSPLTIREIASLTTSMLLSNISMPLCITTRLLIIGNLNMQLSLSMVLISSNK